ncbi:hypothetical protein HK098_005542 [Nowakowskiella sp. JEL0407]|nr:hypothetical protein HK098_005542 [Nowakowskiella sp. JEL0407]
MVSFVDTIIALLAAVFLLFSLVYLPANAVGNWVPRTVSIIDAPDFQFIFLLSPKTHNYFNVSAASKVSPLDTPRWTLFKRWVWTKREVIIGAVLILCNLIWWLLPFATRFQGYTYKEVDPHAGHGHGMSMVVTLRTIGDQLSRKAAWAGMWDAALAIIFAVRENQILKSVIGDEAASYHKRIRFHIALGYACLFHQTYHTFWYIGAYAVDVTLQENLYPYLSTSGYFNFVGLLSWLSIAVMAIFSWYTVRRSKYIVFIVSHQLYIVFLATAYIHFQACFYPMLGPLLYFIWDRLQARLYQRRTVKVHASKLNEKTILLQFPLSEKVQEYAPGDWFNLRIPSISMSEWHPFTLSSYYNDSPKDVSAYVSVTGPWTKKLLKAIEDGKSTFDANMDGLYGARSNAYLEHQKLIVVGGGTGIAALTPFILHYLSVNPSGKVNLIWIVKKIEYAASYQELLDIVSDPRIKVQLFATQETTYEETHAGETQHLLLTRNSEKIVESNDTKTAQVDPESDALPSKSSKVSSIILTTTIFASGILFYVLTRILMTPYNDNVCNDDNAYQLTGSSFFVCFIYYQLAPPFFSTISAALFGWIVAMLFGLKNKETNTPMNIDLDKNLEIVKSLGFSKGRPDIEKVLGEILKTEESSVGITTAGVESMVHSVELFSAGKEKVAFYRESFMV